MDGEIFGVTSNKKELQTMLNLDNESKWQEWLQSRFMQPWWEELWHDYLSKREKQEHSQGLHDIQLRLIHSEVCSNIKYSTMFPDKTDWDSADHLVYFHYHVQRENK